MKKIGVVGYGAIGRHHARNLASLEGVEFVGVADQSSSAREQAASLGFKTFSDVGELFASGIDGLVISAPTAGHFDLAMACIDHGCAALVEKPIASDLSSGTKIVEAARKKGVPIMVGYVERYNPAVIALRDFIARGGLGTVFSLTARRVGTMPARIRDANVLIDIGVHDIDLAAFVTNAKLKLKSALGGRAKLEDRVDYSLLSIDAEGVVVTVESNWITPVKIRELYVTGSNGVCHIDYITQAVRFAPGHDFAPATTFEETVQEYAVGEFTALPVTKSEPLRNELQVFIAGLNGQPLPDPMLSLESLRIAEEATAAIEIATKQGRI